MRFQLAGPAAAGSSSLRPCGDFCALAAIFLSLAIASPAADDLPGRVDLPAVVATVGRLLEQAHYSQHKLDAGMGREILETYLESLDCDKLFFTQEDIDQFRGTYGSGLHDDILLGNLSPAKSLFAILRRRVDKRVSKIDEFLKERHDFTDDRAIISNRARERWPANQSEADNAWRDLIENELLAAKLNAGDAEPGPELIRRRYHEMQNQIDALDDQDIVGIFLEAVAQTYDPHTEYLGPADLNQFKIDTRLTISGIGAEISMKNGCATIDRIFARGPADRSGKLHVGDKIIAVAEGNGPFVNILHSSLDKITELVLGKDGTVVRLEFFSARAKNPYKRQKVSLVREEVRLTEEEARAELIEMHSPGCVQKLGWITVPSFYGEPTNTNTGASVTHDVTRLLSRLEQEGVQGLVIDLRNNGGGSVEEAVKMTELFLHQGPRVQLKDPNGKIHVVQEQQEKPLYEGPMVVLDNKVTASASEIFSGAIQDHRRGPIVGDSSSFGKGTVQAVIELDHFVDSIGKLPDLAGALKITIEKVYRVTGESTQTKGVVSDLKIPSLTEIVVPSENEQAHRLDYDKIAPVSFNLARDGKPLFLDELRRRSIARIKENPLFQDLAGEIDLAVESAGKNRVSLNEKIRQSELAKVARLRAKGDADRQIAQLHDRNKYYRLMLADVNEDELRPINNKKENSTFAQTATQDIVSGSGLVSPPAMLCDNDFDAPTENEAITRETLNILSDLVNLTRAQHRFSPEVLVQRKAALCSYTPKASGVWTSSRPRSCSVGANLYSYRYSNCGKLLQSRSQF